MVLWEDPGICEFKWRHNLCRHFHIISPFFPSPSLPMPLKSSQGSWECCKFSQHGLGQSPAAKAVLAYMYLEPIKADGKNFFVVPFPKFALLKSIQLGILKRGCNCELGASPSESICGLFIHIYILNTKN